MGTGTGGDWLKDNYFAITAGDYDGDGNLEAARFTVEYVPNEYVQVDSEKPLYYMIDDIDFELSEDED